VTLRNRILAALAQANDLTAASIAHHLRASARDVVAELNAMRSEGIVMRRVGNPMVPLGQDRGPARWSRA
jgi:DNA-binding MarR family transcriptional regulator